METTLTTPIAGTTSPSPPQAAAAISADFETFLKMLTVQMKNQDPLNPTEASDFAVQLATFSGVEQQVRTNDLLQAMASQWGGNDLSQMSVWIGKDVRVAGPIAFQGSPLTLVPAPVSYADTAVLSVRDAAGTEVQRMNIPVSNEPVVWAGVDDAGSPFPSGQFSFQVMSFANGELLAEKPAESYARVIELRREDQETRLILSGGSSVDVGAITALREPQQP